MFYQNPRRTQTKINYNDHPVMACSSATAFHPVMFFLPTRNIKQMHKWNEHVSTEIIQGGPPTKLGWNSCNPPIHFRIYIHMYIHNVHIYLYIYIIICTWLTGVISPYLWGPQFTPFITIVGARLVWTFSFAIYIFSVPSSTRVFLLQRLVAGTKLGIRFTSEGFGAGSHHLQCSRLAMPRQFFWERCVCCKWGGWIRRRQICLKELYTWCVDYLCIDWFAFVTERLWKLTFSILKLVTLFVLPWSCTANWKLKADDDICIDLRGTRRSKQRGSSWVSQIHWCKHW